MSLSQMRGTGGVVPALVLSAALALPVSAAEQARRNPNRVHAFATQVAERADDVIDRRGRPTDSKPNTPPVSVVPEARAASHPPKPEVAETPAVALTPPEALKEAFGGREKEEPKFVTRPPVSPQR